MTDMSRIFISYRRADSAGYAGRLYDRLSQRFGQDRIFIDIDTIEPGLDFVEVIEEAVGSCDVLIVLIGSEWLTITDATGRRRLDNPEDFVRLEVATALERNVRVIPVLVGGATVPHSTDLPDVLRRLVRRNALEISDTRFHHDVDRLIETLDKVLGAPEPPPKPRSSPKLVKRPWVAVADLENRGPEEHEPKCFGVSSYLRRILESIPTEYKFGVAPISSLMGFDSALTPGEVYAKTGMPFLLRGALDLRLDPCVIEAELRSTDDDTLLWHQEFNEPWRDVQSITKQIALSVVEQVLMHTEASDKTEVYERIADIQSLIREFPEQKPYDFELYNRGIYKSNRFNNLREDDDFLQAEFDLNWVVERSESPHHEALAQLGFLYILRWETKGDPKLLQQSEKKWEQILETKGDDPFALAELGYVSYVSGSRDAIEAIKLARKAVYSDREHAIANNVLALLYLYLGYYESNITIEKTVVIKRSPTYVYPRTNVALAQQLRGHYDEALESAIEARDIQSKAFVANLLVGAQYFYKGQLDKADRAWAEGQKHCPVKVASILEVVRAWIQVREGNIALARETLQANANAPWLPGPYGPYYSSLAALVGENERAITLLEKDPTFAKSYRYLISEPTLESLKGDPRFHSLLEKRHKEWVRNLGELEAGLRNPPDCYLPSPEEFLVNRQSA
jgi:hypothetical protein